MRSAIFFAVLAMLLISTHAWKHPSWKELEEKARGHLREAKTQLAQLKKNLPTSMQNMMDQAMAKLEQRHVQMDVHNAMEAMERDLMSKLRNLAATQGLRVHDKKALEALMRHMMLAQAHQNMESSTVMETYAHHLATQLMGENRPAHEIKAFGASLSTLAHTYIRKFMEGAEVIMRKNGVNLNKEHLQKVLHIVGTEVMKGKDVMETLMAEMKKMGVNTADLDATVKDQLKAHFEALKTSGMAEVQKLLTAHKVPMAMDKVIAALKIKGREMMEKMKAVHCARAKTAMHKLEALAKKAFKGGDHKKLMMKLHLIVRPALNSHFLVIAKIFKKHKMGTSHTVIHYTIYHRMKKETEEDDHHHHHHKRWWHKKPVRLALIIGGSIFGVAVLVALIIVIVHTLKEQRRTPHKKEIIGGEEKSTLPYSIMDEKSSTQA